MNEILKIIFYKIIIKKNNIILIDSYLQKVFTKKSENMFRINI